MSGRDASPERKKIDEAHLFELCDKYERLLQEGKRTSGFWSFKDLDNHIIDHWYELNIKGPVSEPLRRRLFAIHATQDARCSIDTQRERPDNNWQRARTELCTMYWLMPAEHRKTFFHHSIMNSVHLVHYHFTADPVLKLIQPDDNQGLRYWALMKKEELHKNPETYAMIMEAQMEFEKTHPLKPFCTHIVRLLWKEQFPWFRGYVAFGLNCSLPIWTSLSHALYSQIPPED